MDNTLFLEIPKIIKDALQKQLRVPRDAKTYGGRKKPISGNYPTPKSPPIASGNLINNIDVFWKDDLDSGKPELVVKMPDYWVWVDQGRRPGRYPPLSAIDRWSVVKPGMSGIRDKEGKFIPRKTLNFLRARSIAKYGYYKTDFVNKAINNVIDEITTKLGDAAGQYISDLLDESLKLYFQDTGINIKL
jgi:hypothetical protein